MKIKTSELTGVALDWAVATATGLTIDNLMGGAVWAWSKDALTDEDETIIIFSPSRDWAQAGQIIEREFITLRVNALIRGQWVAFIDFGSSNCNIKARQKGPTALIAAMRCFVASRLGDTVDIPEEL